MVTRDRILGAVLEPRRRAILQALARQDLPAGRLAQRFAVSRPAISQHLSILCGAGLVEVRRVGWRSGYHLRPEGVAAARAALAALAAELPGAGQEAASPAASPPPSAAAPEQAGDPDAVVVATPLPGTPEDVFRHLTDAALVPRWLGERAELDPRPGGALRIELGDDVAAGTFEEVEAPRRVVFTWGAEGLDGALAPGASRVEIAVAPAGGHAHLRLEHRGLPLEARAPHLSTWARHLAELAVVLRRPGA